MATTTVKSALWQGIRDGAPYLLVLAPFSALFGVLATEAGLSVFETLAFAVLVIAGSAQFTALQLMTEHTSTVIVIISALAVNLRMAMYSASLAPHLGQAPIWKRAIAAYLTVDQSYALSVSKYERDEGMSIDQKIAYFFGVMIPIAPAWYAFTLIGALGGKAVPPELALDFAMPLSFTAMIGPMLRTPAHVVAAFVSASGGLLLAGIPYNLGLLIAALIAILAGAQVELLQKRRLDRDG